MATCQPTVLHKNMDCNIFSPIFSETKEITKNLSPPRFSKIGISNFQEMFLKQFKSF